MPAASAGDLVQGDYWKIGSAKPLMWHEVYAALKAQQPP